MFSRVSQLARTGAAAMVRRASTANRSFVPGRGTALSASLAMGIAGATSLAHYRSTQKNLRELTTFEYEAKVNAIKSAFNTSDETSMLVGSLLDSMRDGDYATVQLRLEDLKASGASFDAVTFRNLVHLTAASGRVKGLVMLCEHFGESRVRSLPFAAELLDHESRDEIERVADQFMRGLGNIKEDGERVYLEFMADREKTNLESDPSLAAYGLDPEADALAMLEYMREEKAIAEKNAEKLDSANYFDNTIVLKEYTEKEFKHYLEALKSQLTDNGPIYGNFIFAGGHFVSGDIRVEKTESGVKATLLYFDSMGNTATHDTFSPYVDTLLTVFPNTEFYPAETKLQHAYKGCSIFTLINRGQIAHVGILRNYPQYNYASEPDTRNLPFRYAKDHVTEVVRGEYGDMQGNWQPYTFNLFLTPSFMEVSKQSFSYHGKVDECLTDEKGRIAESAVSRAGHMGLLVQKEYMKAANPDRYLEFTQPMKPSGVTPEEYIERYKQKHRMKGVEKDTNRMVEIKCNQFALRIAPWLVTKTPEQVADIIANRHTLSAYEHQALSIKL